MSGSMATVTKTVFPAATSTPVSLRVLAVTLPVLAVPMSVSLMVLISVMLDGAEEPETFPAVSMAFAVMVCGPRANGAVTLTPRPLF